MFLDSPLHQTIGGRVTKRRGSSAKLSNRSRRPKIGVVDNLKSSVTRLGKRQGLWPNKELYFKTFPDDEAYTYLYEILLERGWKYAGKPYAGTDHNALKKVVKNQNRLPK